VHVLQRGLRGHADERDSKRDARYELRDHRRDHQEHPNWDKWAVCQVRLPTVTDP